MEYPKNMTTLEKILATAIIHALTRADLNKTLKVAIFNGDKHAIDEAALVKFVSARCRPAILSRVAGNPPKRINFGHHSRNGYTGIYAIIPTAYELAWDYEAHLTLEIWTLSGDNEEPFVFVCKDSQNLFPVQGEETIFWHHENQVPGYVPPKIEKEGTMKSKWKTVPPKVLSELNPFSEEALGIKKVEGWCYVNREQTNQVSYSAVNPDKRELMAEALQKRAVREVLQTHTEYSRITSIEVVDFLANREFIQQYWAALDKANVTT